MNLRQPFEQLIAGKLRQLPAPDADASWQQMKRLLDDDDDRGGGGKRPPGNGGWWRIGMLAIVLLTSAWFFIEKPEKNSLAAVKNNPPAAAQSDEGNSVKKSGNNQTSAIDNNTTLPLSKVNTGNRSNAASSNGPVNNNPAAVNTSNTASSIKNAGTKDAGNTALTNNGTNDAATTNTVNNTRADNRGNKPFSKPGNALVKTTVAGELNAPPAGNLLADKKDKILVSLKTRGNKPTATKLPASANNGTADQVGVFPGDGDAQNAIAKKSTLKTRAGKNYSGNFSGQTVPGKYNQSMTADDDTNSGTPRDQSDPFSIQSVTAREKTWFERLTELITSTTSLTYDAALAAGDSIASSRDAANLLNNETKKLVARAQRDRAAEIQDKKDKKKLNLNLSGLFKPFSMHLDTDPRWAAGIALNSAVTVNNQSRYNYNVNAKSSTIADYIPSPYLQFHLNNAVYMQTELNLITPQYTPQLLVYQKSNELGAQAAGMSRQKSIYIEKLYYFNWPLSLHYSPINNLYLAGGVQFSSFQSGLVSIQEKQYQTISGPGNANTTNNTTLKFKDDSIAAKLAPNEWRWQTGADYYWNRFTIGMRYNKSFKDLLNVNVSSSLPLTTNRNSAFLFYMKYNLFESRKKDNSGQQRSLTRF